MGGAKRYPSPAFRPADGYRLRLHPSYVGRDGFPRGASRPWPFPGERLRIRARSRCGARLVATSDRIRDAGEAVAAAKQTDSRSLRAPPPAHIGRAALRARMYLSRIIS